MNLKPILISFIACSFCLSTTYAKEVKRLITEKEKVSYSIGLSIGKNFQQQAIDIDMDALIQGLNDATKGDKQLLTEAEIRQVMMDFQKRMQAKRQDQEKVSSEKNLADGQAFLAKNKNRKGVISLPSGLQYEVIRPGTGSSPKSSDTVVTNYKGTLIDGKEFDSSYKRGKPATFPVSGVIKGWTEALTLMKAGAKWKLYIPPHLAYGDRSAGPVIGPNSTLVFEIELLEVK